MSGYDRLVFYELKFCLVNRSQIQYLYNRFYEFAGGGKDPPSHLYKYNFYSGLLHLNHLLPTILNCMFSDKKTITFVEFAIFLSTFQAHSLKTKTELKNEIKDRKLMCKWSLDMAKIFHTNSPISAIQYVRSQ